MLAFMPHVGTEWGTAWAASLGCDCEDELLVGDAVADAPQCV